MYGYRIHEWSSEPTWDEIAEPSPGPGEVLIDVEACGVGLTVLNCINGDLANDPGLLPRVPGHELVGRVAATGPGVDATLMGRQVVAYFYLICGECSACLAGHEARCANLAGWVGVHRDGGYAPQVVLPAINALPISDQLDPISATVIPDAVATPVHVAARAGIASDDRVVVLGAGGGVGMHMVQVAGLTGAEVAGLDIVDEKLAQIERLGVRAVRSDDFATLDPNGVFPSGRPTVIIDLLGVTDGTRWGLDALGPGGRMVALTTFRDRTVAVESREFVFREISLIGSRYAGRAEVTEAGRLVATGAVTPIIGAVRPPSEVGKIHQLLKAGTLIGRGAIDWRTP